jgi:hypothetical protein
MSEPSETPSAPRSRSRGGANPRPPSPSGSEASFASSTTSFRRMQRDKTILEKKANYVKRESRFDKEDASVDDAMAFLSRPHSTWDSAFHELSRLQSLKDRAESDTCSNMSSVSAYSFKSQASTTSRKGALGMLPKSPPPDLTVGGSGVGGFSFVAPRTGSSTSTIASVKSQRVGAASGSVVAGPAGGKSGIVRAMSTRGPTKAEPTNPNHPQSAPGGQRRQDAAPVAPMFQVSGQFVPTLAPKRGK